MADWLRDVLREFADDGLALLIGIFLGGYWSARLARRTAERIRQAERQEEALLAMVAKCWELEVALAPIVPLMGPAHGKVPDELGWRPIHTSLLAFNMAWLRDWSPRVRGEAIHKLADGIGIYLDKSVAHFVSGEVPEENVEPFRRDIRLLKAALTMLRTEAEHRARGKAFFRAPWWRRLRRAETEDDDAL
jgi:hypothetical protein